MEKNIDLNSRRDYNNYLKRLRSVNGEDSFTYLLITSHPSLQIETEKSGIIVAIEPRGGPKLRVGEFIPEAGATIKFIDYAVGKGCCITFEII